MIFVAAVTLAARERRLGHIVGRHSTGLRATQKVFERHKILRRWERLDSPQEHTFFHI